MKITVIQPGLMTTLQDEGRWGYQASGFPVSGCMDKRALHDANILVNNAPDEAVLEMQVLGGSFLFHGDTYFALTGADMQATLNGAPVRRYCACKASAGDKLELGAAVSGRFAYLSVAGGFRVEQVLGSKSTYVKCKIGGFSGRALKADDELPLNHETPWLWNGYLKEAPAPEILREITVRVTAGPQESMFTEKGLRDFYSQIYTVSDQSDRMGFRLNGAPVESKSGVDIISDAIVEGSIQVPSNGKPMILLADRQTTGGYAKIATVVSADIPKLVQCMPGATVRFEKATVEEAVRIYKEEKKSRRKFSKKTGYSENNLSPFSRLMGCLKKQEGE